MNKNNSHALEQVLEEESRNASDYEIMVISDIQHQLDFYFQENYAVNVISSRSLSDQNPEPTMVFLRNRDRYQNTMHLLQYLLTFNNRLPALKEISHEANSPFDQFRHFIRNEIGLLKEKDVVDFIFKERRQLGFPEPTSYLRFVSYIDKLYGELNQMINYANVPVYYYYKYLFESIKRLAQFWFSVKNNDLKRLRKSDVNFYKISQLLYGKINNIIKQHDSFS
jgi:hypothetical protein